MFRFLVSERVAQAAENLGVVVVKVSSWPCASRLYLVHVKLIGTPDVDEPCRLTTEPGPT